MITTPKILGLLAVAFVAGSFVASPELRAYAAATIGSADIIDESIQSLDIKNGQVKAADIATDAVGAAELQGVTKLLFGQCVLTSAEATTEVSSGSVLGVNCSINGVDGDDSAIATRNDGTGCFGVQTAHTSSDKVTVTLINDCDSPAIVGSGATMSIIVYDK